MDSKSCELVGHQALPSLSCIHGFINVIMHHYTLTHLHIYITYGDMLGTGELTLWLIEVLNVFHCSTVYIYISMYVHECE